MQVCQPPWLSKPGAGKPQVPVSLWLACLRRYEESPKPTKPPSPAPGKISASVLHSAAAWLCVHRKLAYLCRGQFLYMENEEKVSLPLLRGDVPSTCQGGNGTGLESWETAALPLRGHRGQPAQRGSHRWGCTLSSCCFSRPS